MVPDTFMKKQTPVSVRQIPFSPYLSMVNLVADCVDCPHVPWLSSFCVLQAMRQWWELKAHHYDTILFFKVG